MRKKRLEQCQQFALFERSARAAVEWIRETQERCGAAAAVAAAGVARESRERVRLLAQLADGLVEKGHPHAVQIKEWVAAVDARYAMQCIYLNSFLILTSAFPIEAIFFYKVI